MKDIPRQTDFENENSAAGCLEWFWFYEEAQDVLTDLYLKAYMTKKSVQPSAIDEAETVVINAWQKFNALSDKIKKELIQ